MKYQNLRGGRVKLHHIMVRYLLFFSAKKETTTTKPSKTSPLKKKFPLFTLGSFIALMLVGPSKFLKQTILIKHNGIKNPNWPEAK